MFWRARELELGLVLRGRTLRLKPEQVDDPALVLRVAHLVAEHGYALDAKLETALRNAPNDAIGTDTLRDGLTAILAARDPARGVESLSNLGALAVLLPELEAARGIEQFGGFHHLDVLEHSIEALRRLLLTFPDAPLEVRWAALLHDVGKPASKSWDVVRERWSFFGHDQLGGRITRAILERLAYPNEIIERSSLMVDRHMLRLPGDETSALRFARRNRSILPDLLAVMLADREAARGPASNEATRHAYQRGMNLVLTALTKLEVNKPLLNGEDIMAHLGLPPGKRIGAALEVIQSAQQTGDLTTPDEARALLDTWALEIGLEPREETGSRKEESP